MNQKETDQDSSLIHNSTLRQRTGNTRRIADFGSDTKAGLIEWYGSGQDDEDIISPLADLQLSAHVSQGHGQRPNFEAGWRQPRFQPGRAYERMLAKEKLLPPKIGGRSKTEQLGSIEASWGEPFQKSESDNGGEEQNGQAAIPKGMFELIEDPPSRSTSPFKVITQQEEIQTAKAEAWVRARKGTHLDPASTSPRDRYSNSTLNRDYPIHKSESTTSYRSTHQHNDSSKDFTTVKQSHLTLPPTQGGITFDNHTRSHPPNRRYLTAEYARFIERERVRPGAQGRI